MARVKMQSGADKKENPRVIMVRFSEEEFERLMAAAADNLRSPTSQAKWFVLAGCSQGAHCEGGTR